MSSMNEIRQKNEKIKRKYFEWCTEANQKSEKSVRAYEKAINSYDDFTKFDDYASYSSKTAIQFKKYLATNINKRSGVAQSVTSRYHCLRHVRRFFEWLSSQQGYRKINRVDIDYLSLTAAENREATSPGNPKCPTLEQVKKLCSFPVSSEIDRRDRALIALVAITGMRDKAVVTLPLGSYDPDKRVVKQLPSLGVETKFGKDIYTTLVPLDETLTSYFLEWYAYLIKEKKFGLSDPIFPQTEIGMVAPDHHAFETKGISNKFWADAGPLRTIFKQRANEVGVPYFYPHTFRHFLILETEKHIGTPEQMKALSQNVGHEQLATTYRAYGAITNDRANEIVRNLDFSSTNANRQSMDFAKQVAEQLYLMQNKGVE